MRHIPVRPDGRTGSRCPCGVLTDDGVDRERTVDGRRSNRTLMSFVTCLRFAMTARTRFTLDCTGNGHGGLHRRVSGSRGLHDRRAATLTAMLAVASDGQHVVKRFYILPASALA
jgi:hypothetical protein